MAYLEIKWIFFSDEKKPTGIYDFAIGEKARSCTWPVRWATAASHRADWPGPRRRRVCCLAGTWRTRPRSPPFRPVLHKTLKLKGKFQKISIKTIKKTLFDADLPEISSPACNVLLPPAACAWMTPWATTMATIKTANLMAIVIQLIVTEESFSSKWKTEPEKEIKWEGTCCTKCAKFQELVERLLYRRFFLFARTKESQRASCPQSTPYCCVILINRRLLSQSLVFARTGSTRSVWLFWTNSHTHTLRIYNYSFSLHVPTEKIQNCMWEWNISAAKR